jgi:hypothetical protein
MLCGFLLFSGCGGGTSGTMGGGSPNASLSTTSLTFGDEIVNTTSQPLTVTLTNSGTAALGIASVATSLNFQQSNNCGSTLASAANCTIIVIFMPSTAGQLRGTISINDSATGSPQTVSLNGTGILGTTQDTLTGYCWGGIQKGAPQQCGTGQDLADCPVGELAITPTNAAGCLPPQSNFIDTSRACQFQTGSGKSGTGSCEVQVSDTGGSCSVQGQECGAAQLPPCCSGLVCAAASTRAFCQPQ